jgi:hypothetical protein
LFREKVVVVAVVKEEIKILQPFRQLESLKKKEMIKAKLFMQEALNILDYKFWDHQERIQ